MARGSLAEWVTNVLKYNVLRDKYQPGRVGDPDTAVAQTLLDTPLRWRLVLENAFVDISALWLPQRTNIKLKTFFVRSYEGMDGYTWNSLLPPAISTRGLFIGLGSSCPPRLCRLCGAKGIEGRLSSRM